MSDEPPLKTQKMAAMAESKGLTMGTHSGSFQCDEALGIWMLRQLPKWAGATLVRSRDQAVLDTLDIVIDVGGTYDEAVLRFDHHQRGFFETFDGAVGGATCAADVTAPGAFKTKLSACGLVYKHYGRELLAVLCPGLEGPRLEAVYVKLYADLVEVVLPFRSAGARESDSQRGARRRRIASRSRRSRRVTRVVATETHRPIGVRSSSSPLRTDDGRRRCPSSFALAPPRPPPPPYDEGLDAIDNGIEVADEPRYREGSGLSSRIGRLNARWNAPPVADRAADENARFERASALAGGEFGEHLDGLANCWLPARDLVEVRPVDTAAAATHIVAWRARAQTQPHPERASPLIARERRTLVTVGTNVALRDRPTRPTQPTSSFVFRGGAARARRCARVGRGALLRGGVSQ